MRARRSVPGALTMAVAATVGVLGLAVPAAGATGATAGAAGGPLKHGQWLRSNTSQTHSPQVLRALARTSGTVITGPKAAAANGPVAGAPQGIDVSSHQESQKGGINWATIASDGIKFVAIKATEGAYYTNPYAAKDLPAAQAQGLTTVAYAFAIPNGGSNGSTQYSASPVVQADDLLSSLPGAMPVMLDIENDPYSGSDGTTGSCYGLSQPAMVSWISGFDAEIAARTGRLPIIYTNQSWWATCTGKSTIFGQTPIWAASWTTASSPTLPAGWSNWNLWQYTSAGTVNGITGSKNVDLDQLNPGIITLLNPGTRHDPAGSAIPTVPVTPFTVSPAPTLTYGASGLPGGLGIDSGTGAITGTPSQPGSSSVTVTATDGSGHTGTASFTWDAYGTITIAPVAAQQTVAGTAVDLQVQVSDSASGQTPTVTAAGLPPGLAISTSGLITGWPTKAGTYHVTVSAADALGASQTAAFTWTVSAAPGKGPTGQVRLNLAAKCLNDAGNSSKNGAAQDIWTCNSSAAQKWTIVADGTIRIHGRCLDVSHGGTASGTAVDIWACNGSGAQQWQVQTGGELVNPQSGKCLTDPRGSTGNGTRVQIVTCAGKPYQQWTLPAGPVQSGLPGKCLNDTGNRTANGTTAGIWACNGTAAQAWVVQPDGTIRIHGRCLDVSHGGTASGTAVDIWTCDRSGAQQWRLRPAGTGVALVNPASGLVLAVPGSGAATALGSAGTPRAVWRAL
jgi:GH25 family lysozyme M1 (1,4-beta-N-acetylmuramidase)/protocatechuate 3,4-dioxygenase beta subunit